MVNDPFLLEKYILEALSTYDSKYLNRPNYITCRCPFCGDSKKESKKRGYILKGSAKNDYNWVFTCHNGDCEIKDDAISAENFLKYKFPNIYDEYKKEKFNNFIYKNTTKRNEVVVIENVYDEKDDLKKFVSIVSEGEVFELAIKYCIERKIPESVWKKFFVATGGTYQGRMIIPFYDKLGKIYYYQGRTLIGSHPKYLNRKVGPKRVYGNHFLELSKPVMIVEGPIDSLFLENSIAILGLSFSESVKEVLDKIQSRYYILDNDSDGRREARKLLEQGEYVFLWDKFLVDVGLKGEKIKDVNDAILKLNKEKFTFKDLEKYFTNNIYEGVLL